VQAWWGRRSVLTLKRDPRHNNNTKPKGKKAMIKLKKIEAHLMTMGRETVSGFVITRGTSKKGAKFHRCHHVFIENTLFFDSSMCATVKKKGRSEEDEECPRTYRNQLNL
jgi:hypothetical protein